MFASSDQILPSPSPPPETILEIIDIVGLKASLGAEIWKIWTIDYPQMTLCYLTTGGKNVLYAIMSISTALVKCVHFLGHWVETDGLEGQEKWNRI